MNEKQEAGSKKQEDGSRATREAAVLSVMDARLEQVVRGTVGRGLDGQCGRAGVAFAQALTDSGFRMGRGISDARTGTNSVDGERALRRVKLWAGAASVLAASLAVVVTMQVWTKPGGGPTGSGPEAKAKPVSVDQITLTRDVDGGTIVFDDAPLKMVRQQTLRTTQWFDPAEKATFSVTEPVEKVGYVRLRPD